MKLAIPFFRQTTILNCGPAALKMVLSYFGNGADLSALEKECGMKNGKAIDTIQIATAAAKRGYTVEFYSTSVGFNQKNMRFDFYKKYADTSGEKVEDARSAGVKIYEESLSLDDLQSKLSKNVAAIVLLNWNRVLGKPGFQGHFVPVVGYDRDKIYVHDPGGKPHVAINLEVFRKSWESEGTDKDVIFIGQKK